MGSLIASAWRDGIATMRRNPLLYTLAFIAFVILGWAVALVSPVPVLHRAGGAAPGGVLVGLLAGLAGGLVQSVVSVPCAVAAHRSVLIGPGADRHLFTEPRRLVRFYGAGLAIAGFAILPELLMLSGSLAIHRLGAALGSLIFFIGLVLIVAAFIAALRFSLVFPGVATDQPNVWAMSWEKTRGHWWMIFGTTIVCLLPLLLGVGGIALIARAIHGPVGMVLRACLSAVYAIGAVSIGAALLSGFYRRYVTGPASSAAGGIWVD